MTPSPPNSSSYQPVTNVYNNTIHLRQCTPILWGFSCGSVVKKSACQFKRLRLDPWLGKIPWRRKQQPTPVFLPGEFHKQGSLVGYSPQGHRVRLALATELLLYYNNHNNNISTKNNLYIVLYSLQSTALSIILFNTPELRRLRAFTGLAKKFIWVFPYQLREKSK